MLHDPGSFAPPSQIETIRLGQNDRDVLRFLGTEVARIAALPVQQEKADLWRKLNDLESSRAMVWINEIPWHEMNFGDELSIRCSDPWARMLEAKLRRQIYQWKHMPADMVVSDFLECPLAIHSTDFGIHEKVDVARTDEASTIYSRRFNTQIREPDDLAQIKMPVVTYDERQTELVFECMRDIFEDILPVEKVGQTHIWFTPWDYLIRWWGVQEAMLDLIERPQMVHDAVSRMVRAWLVELDQFEQQDLLSLDCRNIRIGSGGYGYTGELPGQDWNPGRVRPQNMWGCSNAQIFSNVSPAMHWEFAVEHDLEWLGRWRLSYYGCCEPLDNKIDLMRKIPNLRKISISPWNDFERVVEQAGDDYVLSVKPNPAVFAEDTWNPERAKADIQAILDAAASTSRNCHIEFIMKDISTVRYEPRRLWEWESIAAQAVEESIGA